jgi:hypothetical protein
MTRRRVVNGQTYILTRRGWRLVFNGCIRTRRGWRKLRQRPRSPKPTPTHDKEQPEQIAALTIFETGVMTDPPQCRRFGRYDALRNPARMDDPTTAGTAEKQG